MLIKLIFKENHKYISNKQRKEKMKRKIYLKMLLQKSSKIFLFLNLRGKFNLKKTRKEMKI